MNISLILVGNTYTFFHLDRLVSSAGRASAFGAAGSGFESGTHHTIGVKIVQAARIKCFVPGI